MMNPGPLIEPLLTLGDNWDSYGAHAPHADALVVASRFIAGLPDGTPEPAVAATPTGGVMVEWVTRIIELAYYFEPDEEPYVYVCWGADEREGPVDRLRPFVDGALRQLRELGQ